MLSYRASTFIKIAVSNIKRNAVYNTFLSLSQVLVPVIVFPYVSRVLGPKGIGDIGFVDSFLQFAVLLAALGIPIYGVREIAKTRHDRLRRSELFSELLLLHFLSTFLISISYCALFTFHPKLAIHHGLFVISLGMMYMQVFMIEWLFQGMEAFSFITKRALVFRSLSVVLIFLFVTEAGDTLVYFLIIFLTGVSNMVVNLIYAKRYVTLRFHGLQLVKHLKPLFYIFSFGIVVSFYTVLDTALLGLMRDTNEVGYYNAATRVVKLVLTVLTAFVLAAIPRLSINFSSGDLPAVQRLLGKSFAYIALIGVPASAGLMVYANDVIMLFAGPGFVPSVTALQIMTASVLIVGLSNVFGMQILNPSNNERLFFRAALVGMFVSLAFNLTLIPNFGLYGTAITNVVTELVVLVLLIIYSARVVDFRPEWRKIGEALISCAPFIPIGMLVRPLDIHPLLGFSLSIGTSAICYFVIQHRVFKNQLIDELKQQVLKKVGVI